MREIKFRAWNKDWKMMVQPDDMLSIHFDGVTNCAVDVDFNITTTNGQRNKNTWEDTEDLVLMQYTGLKDKNGKEIYEGDIVKGGVYYGWEKETGLGVVKFGEWGQDGSGHEYASVTCLGFFIDIKENKFNYIEDSYLNTTKAPSLEIIGNIYENPELLSSN